MPFFRPGDSKDVVNSKRFLFRFSAGCITALLCTIFQGVIYHASDRIDDEPDGVERNAIMLASNSFLIFLFGLTLLYTYKSGPTTFIKVVVVFGPVLVGFVWWIFGYDGSIFHLVIVPVDLALAMSSPADAKTMDHLAQLLMVVFLLGVTLECVDREAHLGIHVYGRSTEYVSSITLWATAVFPVSMNFLLIRSYVANVLEQEQRAIRTVETAYKIANMLANVDLDAAEELLNHEIGSGTGEKINEPLSRLCSNLRTYVSFLPESLFSAGDLAINIADEPNYDLCRLMRDKKSSFSHLRNAVDRMLDSRYSLENFHCDMIEAFPELQLYLINEDGSQKTTVISGITSSGRTVTEEYERTLGALYAVYSLLRLQLDGKQVFSFGVGDDGAPLKAPEGIDAEKKTQFYKSMPWDIVNELLIRAEVLQDEGGRMVLRRDRVIALLALTAIHDIMKNKSLLPIVSARHAPFRGYQKDEQIGDHDTALEYVLDKYPWVLPAFKNLEPGQRAPILFSQGKMGFNNGWLVQGEAPPGALFGRFKKVITEGRTSQADINFYFIHWLTDLAGAEPFGDKPWPGAEKFTVKFPVKVLSAFLKSFGFVDHLALNSETQTMEQYLLGRWTELGLCPQLPSHNQIALMRLTLMAQGFEKEIVEAFGRLLTMDQIVLASEFARTGCREHFSYAPKDVVSEGMVGPAILIYYAPALIQKAGAAKCFEALRVLADVFRAARRLFPLEAQRAEDTVIVRIDVLKVLDPEQVWAGSPWHLRRTSETDAEVHPGVVQPDASDVKLTILRLL